MGATSSVGCRHIRDDRTDMPSRRCGPRADGNGRCSNRPSPQPDRCSLRVRIAFLLLSGADATRLPGHVLGLNRGRFYQTSPARQSQVISPRKSRRDVSRVSKTMMKPSSSGVRSMPEDVRTPEGPCQRRQPRRS